MSRRPAHRFVRVRLTGDCRALACLLVPDGVEVTHQFTPEGFSVARLGRDSVVAIHSWPERGVATVDGYGGASVDLASRLNAEGWVVLE